MGKNGTYREEAELSSLSSTHYDFVKEWPRGIFKFVGSCRLMKPTEPTSGPLPLKV